MTPVSERLLELRRHLDHLEGLRKTVTTADDLAANLTLHNDVLFSLLTATQLVIDIAGELSARNGLRFEDYTTAVRNLARLPGFSAELIEKLVPLPGFRNVLIHDYVGLDLGRAVAALDRLDDIRAFARIVADMEADGSSG